MSFQSLRRPTRQGSTGQQSTHLALAATLALAPLCALAEGNSPWLPIPGQASVSLGYTDQTASDAFIGGKKVAVKDITGGGASSYDRSSTGLRFDYGFSDAVAFDGSISYGKTSVGKADNDSGATDAVLGLRWRVLDEYEQPGTPTVTLRAAAILKGSYDGARLAALGKDANGFELSVIVGKQLTPEFSVWGELGTQNRSDNVPTATFYELGGRVRVAPQWSLSLGYSNKKFDGNLDIGGAGFSPARFQQVAEERSVLKFGVGFALAANQGLALSYGKVQDGRNTVNDDRILGLSYTYAFN